MLSETLSHLLFTTPSYTGGIIILHFTNRENAFHLGKGVKGSEVTGLGDGPKELGRSHYTCMRAKGKGSGAQRGHTA